MDYDVFIISPVRGITEQQIASIRRYIQYLRDEGRVIYWPYEDTGQNDDTGYAICRANRKALENSKAVHVWWQPDSEGSLFDLGMAWALNKPMRLINLHTAKYHANLCLGKCFHKVLLEWTR